MAKKCLYEDSECEKRFMETLKTYPQQMYLLQLMRKSFKDSSLDSDVIWILFNYTFNRKFKIDDENANLIDKPNIEVDIIGGKCASIIVSNATQPQHIPLLNFITAIEVKCSIFDNGEENEEKKLKAKQRDDEQRAIQKQLYDRLKMGFNKVSLLELLVTNQGKGQNSDAWLNASYNATIPYDIMEKDEIFKNRLSNESLTAVGHYVFKKGSVKKDEINEFLSGSGEVVVKKETKLNPFLKDEYTIRNRKIIEEALNRDLSKVYFYRIR
ncbi:MAG: hypothetical protein ACYCSW_09945 [bacterium]|jgi:hypothetical protein